MFMPCLHMIQTQTGHAARVVALSTGYWSVSSGLIFILLQQHNESFIIIILVSNNYDKH